MSRLLLLLALFLEPGFLLARNDKEQPKTDPKADPKSKTDAKVDPKTDPKPKPKPPAGPAPTMADVHYGPHERQVLDFYQAKSDTPTPVVFAIHGGGWVNGDKSGYRNAAKRFNDAGISLVAINYRMIPEATQKGIEPPVKWPLEDAKRALQFIRSKAKEWNLDKTRIGATGGSAGGCSSLWLAFHDDMADPKSEDPVARESTRLYCAAVNGAQTTLDPVLLREWMPNYGYGGHAFVVKTGVHKEGSFKSLMEHREALLPWIKEYSPLSHVSPGDPPIFMEYGGQKTPPVKGEKQDDPTHSALLGMLLMEKLQDAKVEAILVYPGHPHEKYKNSADFLIDRLKAK
jgi:acetyl esterase/lipase